MRKPGSPKPKKQQLLSDIVNYGLDNGAITAIQNYMLHPDQPPPQVAKDMLAFFLAGRSNSECRWAALGKATIEDEFDSAVVFAGYEWMSFKLPGGSYTPDWDYRLADGRWVLVEVKANVKQSNYRDARSKLRAAAALNPWFDFVEVMAEKGGGFELERIRPEAGYVNNLHLFIKDY
jgi:hypothetical protein